MSNTKATNSNTLPSDIPLVEIPTQFINYFENKVLKLREGLGTPCTDPNDNLPTHTFTHFRLVSPDDVTSTVLRSPLKTCDLDPLSTNYVKKFINTLAPFLTHFFNTSLSAGTVPSHFKTAIIRPLIKKPDLNKNIFKNYRPVSNLSFLSKVLERIVASQLNGYLSKYKLCTKCQSAYRANHSTETALVRVHNDIMLALNEKKGCCTRHA